MKTEISPRLPPNLFSLKIIFYTVNIFKTSNNFPKWQYRKQRSLQLISFDTDRNHYHRLRKHGEIIQIRTKLLRMPSARYKNQHNFNFAAEMNLDIFGWPRGIEKYRFFNYESIAMATWASYVNTITVRQHGERLKSSNSRKKLYKLFYKKFHTLILYST